MEVLEKLEELRLKTKKNIIKWCVVALISLAVMGVVVSILHPWSPLVSGLVTVPSAILIGVLLGHKVGKAARLYEEVVWVKDEAKRAQARSKRDLEVVLEACRAFLRRNP